MHCKMFVYMWQANQNSVCAHAICFFFDRLKLSFMAEVHCASSLVSFFFPNPCKQRQFQKKNEMKTALGFLITSFQLTKGTFFFFFSTIQVSKDIFFRVVSQCQLHTLNQNKFVVTTICFFYSDFVLLIISKI